MSEGRDFLSRWSQRKREAVRAEQPEAAEPAGDAPVDEAVAAAGAASADAATPAPPELSDEELARLPRLEDLTAESDLSVFLRNGVPQVLRNAALRKAWALDPKIRDFVCEAREYAYDWNVPGGVPGNGPLLPSDDVKAMVARIFGDAGSQEEGQQPVEALPPDGGGEPRPVGDQAVDPGGDSMAGRDEAAEAPDADGDPAPEAASVRAELDPPAAEAELTVRRRHGGAFPL